MAERLIRTLKEHCIHTQRFDSNALPYFAPPLTLNVMEGFELPRLPLSCELLVISLHGNSVQ